MSYHHIYMSSAKWTDLTDLLHTGNLMLLTNSTAIILMNLFKYEFDPPKKKFFLKFFFDDAFDK